MMDYYNNINRELLALVPLTAHHVLEVGCGAGAFAQAVLARNPSARYVGVELFETAAQKASCHLHHVVASDIELPMTMEALDKVRGEAMFDTLILGDVLEHLHEPWLVLAELRRRMVPDGVCVSCIPNIAHWSVVLQLLRGRWDYKDCGLLDRSHLRFFTLETALEMFQQAGWTVLEAKPRFLHQEKTLTEEAVKAFAILIEQLGVPLDKLRRDMSAIQWVIRAVNGAKPQGITVAGIGLKKFAGVTEARVDHPLAALASLPGTQVSWDSGGVHIPKNWEPGVFILHRQFMQDPHFNSLVEAMIGKGWIIVSDIDDDPHHWKEFVETDFYAYRAVHAVTVSTEPLAEMIRQWNPNVQIFPNAVFALPEIPAATPKRGETLRVFFGALNREGDWASLMTAFVSAAQELTGRVEFVVVHDRAFFDLLPEGVPKQFRPTLPYEKYMTTLASCDVALLPLVDSPFNRLKSDLKFVECCAAGVVPICSPVVYDQREIHREIGLFAETPEEWKQSLQKLCWDAGEISRRRALGLEYVKQQRMHCHQARFRKSYYQKLVMHRVALEEQRRERMQGIRS